MSQNKITTCVSVTCFPVLLLLGMYNVLRRFHSCTGPFGAVHSFPLCRRVVDFDAAVCGAVFLACHHQRVDNEEHDLTLVTATRFELLKYIQMSTDSPACNLFSRIETFPSNH